MRQIRESSGQATLTAVLHSYVGCAFQIIYTLSEVWATGCVVGRYAKRIVPRASERYLSIEAKDSRRTAVN